MSLNKLDGAKEIRCRFTPDGECAYLIAQDQVAEAPPELRDKANRQSRNTYCPNCPYRPNLITLPHQPE